MTDRPAPDVSKEGGVVETLTSRMSVHGRLFQARMWRQYAGDWDRPEWHIKRSWVERILKVSRAECIRRARVNVYLARRLNRSSAP